MTAVGFRSAGQPGNPITSDVWRGRGRYDGRIAHTAVIVETRDTGGNNIYCS